MKQIKTLTFYPQNKTYKIFELSETILTILDSGQKISQQIEIIRVTDEDDTIVLDYRNNELYFYTTQMDFEEHLSILGWIQDSSLYQYDEESSTVPTVDNEVL